MSKHQWLLLLTTALVVAACGEGGDEGVCSSAVQPGDLVITEVFVDPAGVDEGR